MPYFSHDDIAQIGTPPGNGGVGALRITGDGAFALVEKTTTGLESVLGKGILRATHPCGISLRLARIGSRERVTRTCPARVFLMPAPRSYTRENMAEIHLPGSPVLLRAALSALVDAGARPAAPGEFTFRAFRNGRLSLAQAEAVEAVIRSCTDAERRRALARLGDRGLEGVRRWRERLADLAAMLEASLDFSGEEVGDELPGMLATLAAEVAASGTGLRAAERAGEATLPHLALVGLANAGKSSLMNRLLEKEDMLVADQAGTTRDSLRRELIFGGVRVSLSDNPGYNPRPERGVDAASLLAQRRLGGEDVACWVVDAGRDLDESAAEFAATLRGPALVVLNKTDLAIRTGEEEITALADSIDLPLRGCVRVSARTGRGLEALKERLAQLAQDAEGTWNGREMAELAAAGDCCRAAVRELSGPGRIELAAEEVRRALDAFSHALGEGYAEEALGRIFSRFCIGK